MTKMYAMKLNFPSQSYFPTKLLLSLADVGGFKKTILNYLICSVIKLADRKKSTNKLYDKIEITKICSFGGKKKTQKPRFFYNGIETVETRA